MNDNRKIAVCLFGDYDPAYPRIEIIKRGLEKKGIKLFECNCHLRSAGYLLRGKWTRSFLYLLKVYPRLLLKFCPIKNQFSGFIVPHSNQLIIPVAWLLARIFRKRIITDVFDPLYRGGIKEGFGWIQVRTRYYLENVAFKLSDYLLVTTNEIKRLIQEDYRIKDSKFILLPSGANQERFYPRNQPPKSSSDSFTVIYWGKFHIQHGVEIIIKAADLLKDYHHIQFILAGSLSPSDPNRSRKQGKIDQLLQRKDISNINFTGFLPDYKLIDLISRANVCLGIFSDNIMAISTVPWKVFEALAMRKALITEESPAIKAWFQHKKHLYLVPPESPNELAEAILELKNDPQLRDYIAEKGHLKFQEEFSEVQIGQRLMPFLCQV